MPAKLTLYVCHIDDGGPWPHACRRAHEALREAGHDYETVIFGRGHRFGLFTKGRRPRLKEMSGQEKLPVLQWPDGTTIAGSGNIVAWAKANPPSGEADPPSDKANPPSDEANPPSDGETPPSHTASAWSSSLPTTRSARSASGPGFWASSSSLATRDEGAGWQSSSKNPVIGVHQRGRGPGDSFSLPVFRRGRSSEGARTGRGPRWERRPPGRVLGDLQGLRREPVRARGGRFWLHGLVPSLPTRRVGTVSIRRRCTHMKTVHERAEEQRQAKLELMKQQVKAGTLVVRKMTAEEREKYPAQGSNQGEEP